MNRWPQTGVTFALLLSSISCGDSSGPKVGTIPAKIELASSINASGYEPTATIPTAVVVRDRSGLPVPDVEVLFSANQPGFVSLGSVLSDDEGIATTEWTLGAPAGANNLVISVPSVPSIAPIEITTTTVAGAVVGFIIKPPAATLPQGSTLALEAYGEDRYGNLVKVSPISWTTSDAAVAAISAGSLTATGPGVATITATYQPAGTSQTMGATVLVSVPVPAGPGGPGIPAFSIATTVADDYGITVLRSDGTVESRITCGTECEYLRHPQWSRDGSKLSLTGKRDNLSILFVANRDGSDLHEVVSTPALHILTSKGGFDYWPQFHEDWSTGDELVYIRPTVTTASIETVHSDGTGRKTLMTGPGVVTTGDLLRLTNTRWGLGDALITANIDQQLTAMNADGTNVRQLAPIGFDEHVWSPDGSTIAFLTAQGNQSTISLVDPATASLRSMVLPISATFCWTPNSSGFSFISLENQAQGWNSIYVVNRDGTGLRKVVPVVLGADLAATAAWSPDGKFVVYADDRVSTGGADGAQLYAQSVDQGTNTRLSDIAKVNFFIVAGNRCTRGIH